MTPRRVPTDLDPGQRTHPRLRDVQPAGNGAFLGIEAVPRAVRLVRAIRDEGPHSVALETDHLDRQELIALVVALAAMVPADVDPAKALAWIDLPAAEWPADLLVRESARHDDGARDATAVLAAAELNRRFAAMVPQRRAS